MRNLDFCRYKDSTISLLPKSENSNFCSCTNRFESDLVGNTNCWFSHSVAQIFSGQERVYYIYGMRNGGFFVRNIHLTRNPARKSTLKNT